MQDKRKRGIIRCVKKARFYSFPFYFMNFCFILMKKIGSLKQCAKVIGMCGYFALKGGNVEAKRCLM